MKLFLAGADMDYHIEPIYKADHPSMLSSYWKHKDKFLPSWLEWYNKTRDADWIMDSGLFTMMFGAGSDKTYSEDDLLDYTYNYLKNMKSIKYEHYLVEMDVHKVLGLESLKRFRSIFKKHYDLNKTIYVWHIEEGEKGFEKLCKTYPYIAISVPELRIICSRKKIKSFIKYLIIKANKINPNIKIHLLGCTQQNLMEQKGYYSCDSTSWMSSVKYGQGFYFDGNKITGLNIHTNAWKSYFNKYKHMKFAKGEKDYHRNLYLCALAYNKLNKHINNKYYNYEPIKKILK